MIYLKTLAVFLFFTVVSCDNIRFVYNEDNTLTNPLYNKTAFRYSGAEDFSIYRYSEKYFGNSSDPNYLLRVEIEEEKTKRSVQKNQAVSKLDYEIKFKYILTKVENDCLLYNRDIYSRFSYIPKSEGYNFGSDESLNKMYELAIEDNLRQFINFISNKSLLDCQDED